MTQHLSKSILLWRHKTHGRLGVWRCLCRHNFAWPFDVTMLKFCCSVHVSPYYKIFWETGRFGKLQNKIIYYVACLRTYCAHNYAQNYEKHSLKPTLLVSTCHLNSKQRGVCLTATVFYDDDSVPADGLCVLVGTSLSNRLASTSKSSCFKFYQGELYARFK